MPNDASNITERLTSRAVPSLLQASMCVGGSRSSSFHTTVPSMIMLNSASLELGQSRSSTSIRIVEPLLFVIFHLALVLMVEKFPISISAQMSGVGVAVRVGVLVNVAVGEAVYVDV